MQLRRVSLSCPKLKQSLFWLKKLVIAACLFLVAILFYLLPKYSPNLYAEFSFYWPEKDYSQMNTSETMKDATKAGTSLNGMITGPGVAQTSLNKVNLGLKIDQTTRPEKTWNGSITGTTSRSDDVIALDLDAQFQNVNNKNIWVYSAHYDDFYDTAPVLRILGIGKKEMNHVGIYCHVTEQGKTIIIQGKQENIGTVFDKNDSTSIFSCVLKEKSKPTSVSLTFNMTDVLTNRIRVIYPGPLQRNFTVCHAALFNFNKPKQIINSFEINRIFGAQHFYVYNQSVSNTTDTVLRRYQKLGILTILQWKLPATDAWYHGQLLAINDCMYRNRGVSKFVVIHDTDEYIIPEEHDSWAEVLKVAEDGTMAGGLKTVGSFLFQHSFYHNSSSELWDSIKRNFSMTADEEAFLTKNALFPFIHTMKEPTVYNHHDRSKTIVRPEWVFQSGIHFVLVHRKNAVEVVVNRSLAVLHHYRRSPNTNVTEISALRFLRTVMPVLKAAYNALVMA